MKKWRPILWFAFSIAIGLWLRWIYPNAPLVDGMPTMADGDCYTRMHRVELILQGKGFVWAFHDFENYPLGIVPHTTFPFDGLIVGTALVLSGLKSWVISPLEWAGMVISPLLFVALAGSLFWISSRERGFFYFDRDMISFPVLVFGLATLPGLIWATPFGRPDHQSLLMVLIFIALVGELKRWGEDSRFWNLFLGVVWGVSIWTSFYEPLMILGGVAILNVLFRRRESPIFFGVIFGIVVMTGIVEGYRFSDLGYLQERHIAFWFHTIGETMGLGMKEFFLVFTAVIVVLPGVVFWKRNQIKKREVVGVMSGLSIILIAFTFYQRRWLYFSAIPYLILMAMVWPHLGRWWRVFLAALFVSGIGVSTLKLKSDRLQETPFVVESREIAKSIQGGGGILAPWWISPSLLFFSGEPIVASSSHQSISGIVDSACFFRGSNWIEAEEILKRRKVRWIVAYDEDRVLQNSSDLLGEIYPSNEKSTWAYRLWRSEAVPRSLTLRAATPHLRLYEYGG